MSRFFRSGHWRTNAYGTNYWVEGHYVGRDDWNRSTGNVVNHQTISSALSLNLSILQSYTIPNALCPRCGAEVFFYKSLYGGAVFFDELGPPWPKHPCMISDLELHHLARPTISVSPETVHTKKTYSWQTNGWSLCLSISLHKVNSCIYEVIVNGDPGQKYYFKCHSENLHEQSAPMIVHLKKLSSSEIKISFYWIGLGCREFHAYMTLNDALNAVSETPKVSEMEEKP